MLDFSILKLNTVLEFLTFQDILEISFIWLAIYKISSWLKKDNSATLLKYFYLYGFAILFSHLLNLELIFNILITITPIVAVLFIIFHQDILQKNFIKLTKSPRIFDNFAWLNEFIKISLIAINKNKDVTFILQKDFDISTLLKTQYKFYADVEPAIFELLIDKQNNSDNYMIWLNKEGKLVAINAYFDQEILNLELSNNIHLDNWEKYAVYISTKTDAIFLKVNSLSRNFRLIIDGKIADNLSSDQAFRILQSQFINKNSSIKAHGKDSFAKENDYKFKEKI